MKLTALLLLCSALSAPVIPARAGHAAQPLPAGNTLAGLKIGMDKDDAHTVLTAQGAVSSQKDTEGQKKADGGEDKHGDPDSAVPEIWTLKGTPYERVAFAVDDSDKVIWVTEFARAGQGTAFASLGSLARAAASGPSFAVWNVISPAGSYRVVARGQGGKASVVSLLPLRSANPNGAFSPQIRPKVLAKPPILPAAKGKAK